ncbi:MBL fold metallo-hydrolase [Parasulfuritortus cantonensis]|uniref:MBL fold metallo-hydrolase n=1 Tax=Parasulfuritortus cantonensis TaxID=2528202 RepID=A0A4R1B5P4_9PROT|nr:MBL fold metallo-hydrolase [Parasulfuritortus cantonensis]TCJ13462.1 MBL fold metallo-hydrolase [Parasulfuritortus cantonensis]
MRFASLGSGSKGNAWLVEQGTTRVLIDCGFGLREMAGRLARLGLAADDVSAILVTHEHSDHGRGVARFAARHACPVWLTPGCRSMLEGAGEAIGRVHEVDSQGVFAVGDLEFRPFPVPHDAREPVQYVVGDGARRWGLLTDAGHVTAHMVAMLDGCDALALECNHDVDRLRRGRYPATLKARILGRYGHLDNAAAASLLGSLNGRRLQHVVAAHLSEENNTPELARAALAAVLDCTEDWVAVADQSEGIAWRSIV